MKIYKETLKNYEGLTVKELEDALITIRHNYDLVKERLLNLSVAKKITDFGLKYDANLKRFTQRQMAINILIFQKKNPSLDYNQALDLYADSLPPI